MASCGPLGLSRRFSHVLTNCQGKTQEYFVSSSIRSAVSPTMSASSFSSRSYVNRLVGPVMLTAPTRRCYPLRLERRCTASRSRSLRHRARTHVRDSLRAYPAVRSSRLSCSRLIGEFTLSEYRLHSYFGRNARIALSSDVERSRWGINGMQARDTLNPVTPAARRPRNNSPMIERVEWSSLWSRRRSVSSRPALVCNGHD